VSARYDKVIKRLARSYDHAVNERASRQLAPWKLRQSDRFLALLRLEGRRSLLEIGSGTGVHGRYFADAGLYVVCTDLSAAMVEYCRKIQGLTALRADVLHLRLERTFDAAFAMNCLLHVPIEDLPDALTAVHDVLVPRGLFYLGQYGGIERSGVFRDDTYEPKRFFSRLTDEQLLEVVAKQFNVVSFEAVDVESDDGGHFQSVVLRT
jgi:SAM-dependent methyltransferase